MASRKKSVPTIEIDEDKYYRVGFFTHHECCDCALVHDVEYRIEEHRGLIELFERWRRNDAMTKQARANLRRSSRVKGRKT